MAEHDEGTKGEEEEAETELIPSEEEEAETELEEAETELVSGDDSSTLAVPDEAEPFGLRAVGPYRLLQRVGIGGMGEVWLAEQSEPLRRRVALKLVRVGMDTKEVVARFETERQALAMMDHPSIARVYDAGTAPDGRPYFAMEYVQGDPITVHCDRARASMRDRIELMIEVCSAVRHAHQKAIIHRDLKPSNILIAVQDDRALPKVIDFGVAKAMGHKLSEHTMYTQLGQTIGTLDYMSPEQAEMSGQDVDTRTDVYALGVVLYQLLVGALPFDSKEMRSAGYDEARRRIREVDPPRPSTRVSSLGEASTESARKRGIEVATLESELRGDLDWITLKALEKDRTRRYGSPGELAADLRRYLNDEPALASPPSTAYRARKFVRRHRVAVSFAATLLVGVVALAGTMTVQARRIAVERDRANREAQVATAALEFMTDLFEISDPGEARGNTITAREVLDKAAAEIEGSFEDQPEIQARLMATIGRVYQSLGLYEPAEEHLRAVLAMQRRAHGNDHPDVAEALADLAWLLHFSADYDESEALYREALEIRRKFQDDEPVELAWALSHLGNALDNQGDYQAAAALHREALAMGRELLEPTDPQFPGLVMNTANVLAEIGESRSSAELYREVIELYRNLHGEDHYWVAFAMDNLAEVLQDLGEYEEAGQLYFEALARIRKIFGEHPELALTLNRVAWFLVDQGELTRAEEMTREALALNRQLLDDAHDQLANALTTLADLQRRKGDYVEAERSIREAIETYRRAVPEGHPRWTDAESVLGSVEAGLGHLDEAEPLLVRSFEALKERKARAHFQRRALARVIEFYEATGRREEAARYRGLSSH